MASSGSAAAPGAAEAAEGEAFLTYLVIHVHGHLQSRFQPGG